MNLTACVELLDDVEEHLNQMKGGQEVKPIKVKAMLENLRSSLEYLANDIYDIISPAHKKRPTINFPYANPKFIHNFFNKKLLSTPEQLEPLYSLITSIQDYHTGDNWLVMMCNLTNEVKHRKPISLDIDEKITSTDIFVNNTKLFEIEGDGRGVNIKIGEIHAGNTVVKGFQYNGGQASVESSSHENAVNLKITTDKKIRFHGHDYEVIPFIEKCIQKLRAFIKKAYETIESFR